MLLADSTRGGVCVSHITLKLYSKQCMENRESLFMHVGLCHCSLQNIDLYISIFTCNVSMHIIIGICN